MDANGTVNMKSWCVTRPRNSNVGDDFSVWIILMDAHVEQDTMAGSAQTVRERSEFRRFHRLTLTSDECFRKCCA